MHQRGPATYGNIFSLARAFTATRMFSGFPLLLEEIPRLSFFFFSALTFFFAHFLKMDRRIHIALDLCPFLIAVC